MTGRVSLAGLAECEMSVEGDTRKRRGGVGVGTGMVWVGGGGTQVKCHPDPPSLLVTGLIHHICMHIRHLTFYEDFNLKTCCHHMVNDTSVSSKNSSVINI